jgi:hypothetical protein
MRRFVAIVVLLVAGFFTTTPLLTASSGLGHRLPVCCRRGGAHHCETTGQAESNMQFLRSVFQCPFLPHAMAVFVTRLFVASGGVAGMYVPDIYSPELRIQTQTQYNLFMSRSRQKRGPPLKS